MEIIDSQIHLFGPGSEEYAARIEQTILPPEAVIARMNAAGVQRAYLVPGGGTAGNEACIEASKRWPARFRVMGIVALDKPESRDILTHWSPDTPFVGVRLAFAPFRKVSWLKDGTSDWFWAEANRLELPVMVWAPGQLAEVSRIAGQYPRVRLIIDHMGLYVEDKDGKVDQVVQDLVSLARHDNVAVKASSLPAHSSEPYPFTNLHACLQQVVESFGADRVMWGSDLTRLDCTYEQAVGMFTSSLPFLSASQLDRIMGRTAMQWIGW